MSTLRVNNMTNIGGDGPTYAKGSVIQNVTVNYSTAYQTNSSSFVDVSGLSATITPKSVNSKIRILVSANHRPIGTSNYANTENKLFRGSTELAFQQWEGQGANGTGGGFGYTSNLTFDYLDSPNTTSATTYKVQTRLVSGLWSIFHTANSYSSITLQEIAG